MNRKITLDKVRIELKSLYNIDFVNDLLNISGARVFLFGGAIRDMLLGKKMKEADIRMTLNKDWAEREKLTERALKKIHIQEKTRIKQVGLTVYRFLPKGSKTIHEIDFSLTPTLRQNKPDFTINSLFVDLKTGEIIDSYNGVKDLQRKTLRTVKNPFIQFKQEPQMMFRAVKCVCQFNLSIETNTYKAIVINAPYIINTLEYISNVRTGILPELFLSNVFRGLAYNPHKCFELYNKTGILNAFLIFLATKLNITFDSKKKKRSLNFFPKKSKKSFEHNISLLLSFFTQQLTISNYQKVFNSIKKILTLNIPKQYHDLEVDISLIKYLSS